VILELDHFTFKKHIEKGIILVDFGAPWCPPCRVQEPILEELSGEYADTISIAKVNVDKESELAAQYKIQGLPTLLLFKEGKLINSLRGLQKKEEIKSKLSILLK
jgi:thioredoxin 1